MHQNSYFVLTPYINIGNYFSSLIVDNSTYFPKQPVPGSVLNGFVISLFQGCPLRFFELPFLESSW
jgi:hypothetical protein